MAQARRKLRKTTKSGSGLGQVRRYLHPCWLMLVTGLLCGSLSTWLYLGWQGADVGMGQGLKTLLHVNPALPAKEQKKSTRKPAATKPKYDFYTRLLRDTPVPKRILPPAATKPISKAKPKPTQARRLSSHPAPPANKSGSFGPGISYMLQAGSYPGFAEADKLRAKLALNGLESHIEKISIQGRGFYRVRLGPYFDKSSLQQSSKQLRNMGLAANQIKLRRPGKRK